MMANFNLTQKLDMAFKEKQSNNFPKKNSESSLKTSK